MILALLGSGLTATAAQAAPLCNGLTVTINGTDGNDTLTGTSGNDVISGGNGYDTINGGDGDDVICGGNADDVINGGAGRDTVLGNDGHDTLFGEAGDDSLDGGNGDDVLDAGDGDDALVGGAGHDSLVGGAGNDTISDVNGNDTLDGGVGDDMLDAGNGHDTLLGGPGTDNAVGGDGNDRCVDAETTTGCEVIETSPPVVESPLEAQGPAPAGIVNVDGPDGVRLEIDSAGGITPWDVWIAIDEVATSQVADSLASPVYHFGLPEGASMNSARVTVPYFESLVGDFPAADLRLYYLDDDLGLWLPAEGDQVVDTVARTVSTTVTHFSSYAVFKLDQSGFAKYWPTRETYCLQSGDQDQVGVDVAFVIDTSGSMGWNDPAKMRIAGAKAFVEQMRPIDGAAVVNFDSWATTQLALTSLSAPAGKANINAALTRAGYATGGTNIASGVSQGLFALEASTGLGRAKVLILMTDGDSSYSDYLTQTARDQGVVIFTIGLGDGVQSSLLQTIATETGGQFLPLTSADQLPALYASLGKGLIDDGTDADQDGLTDCEETYGVLTSYGFYDVSNELGANDPFLGNRRVVSDPNDADSDDDTLTDGEELRGKGLSQPIDLRDYEATRTTYKFLIDAGITKYFVGRSLPTVVDSDKDTVSDADETNGIKYDDGTKFTSRADRRDTDFDLATDDLEYQRGTDPRIPDSNELGIPGLAPFTLFQPQKYVDVGLDPVPAGRYVVYGNNVGLVQYDESVVGYDSDWNCTSNCAALIAAAPEVAGSWCWMPWGANCDTDAKVRTLVKRAVDAQRIFNSAGDFQGSYVAEQAAAECARNNSVANCKDPALYKDIPATVLLDDPAVVDGPPNDNLDATIHAASLAAGPLTIAKMCSKSGLGGVYELVNEFGTVVYVGQTNNFARRESEHKAGFPGKTFRIAEVADDYNVRRGLEQALYNKHWGDVDIKTANAMGSLNAQRPMSAKRKTILALRAALVQKFRTLC